MSQTYSKLKMSDDNSYESTVHASIFSHQQVAPLDIKQELRQSFQNYYRALDYISDNLDTCSKEFIPQIHYCIKYNKLIIQKKRQHRIELLKRKRHQRQIQHQIQHSRLLKEALQRVSQSYLQLTRRVKKAERQERKDLALLKEYIRKFQIQEQRRKTTREVKQNKQRPLSQRKIRSSSDKRITGLTKNETQALIKRLYERPY